MRLAPFSLLGRLRQALPKVPTPTVLSPLAFRSLSLSPRLLQVQPNDDYDAAQLSRKTTKHPLSRKTFLIDYYKYLNDNNQIVLYLHHNNLVKNDTLKVRSELKKLGVTMTYLRNALYRVYLRSAHEEDPALHKNTLKNKNVEHPLAPLLNGPSAVITIKDCDPPTVEKVVKLLKSQDEKLFLIGARIEGNVYNVADVDQFKQLPTKEQLQGQLAGVLTILGGAGLVRTLESAGTHMYLTLEQRRKDLDPEEKKDEE
ncbi:uncharacterized protein CXQ87_004765 [Candidozyma duobushaemuli]|uniref:Ribosomal protein L10 n=2 Tax=Candidozyma TaxID=3303203 RepID=A0ABX8IF60_9ASCO|nr:uncharacterized protein CXQ87_004765 [[Candida] duobushaemulonis]PVH16474.1 hypothetical protein CXQ87_004765 [[Candida] duobushaemulonis]QWU90238.1 hypothetical protein CA3LBN_004599 [[Candida] haemuloni]